MLNTNELKYMKTIWAKLSEFNDFFSKKFGWFFINGNKSEYSKSNLAQKLNEVDLMERVNIKSNLGLNYKCENCNTVNNTWYNLYYKNFDERLLPISKLYISYCAKCANHKILDLNLKDRRSSDFFNKKVHFQNQKN